MTTQNDNNGDAGPTAGGATFVDLAHALAPLLSHGPWTVTDSAEKWDHVGADRAAQLESSAAGLKLWICASWPRGRVKIGASPLKGEFPRVWDAAKGRHVVATATDITVALGRSVEQIRREVERRLLAGCIPAAHEAARIKTEQDDRQARKEGLAVELAKLCGREPSQHNAIEWSRYDDGLSVRGRVDGVDSVRLELSDVTAEQARCVLACLVTP